VIDAPTPAATAPAPTGRRRGPVSPRPDDRLLLLEAIHRRDERQVCRLVERWVHRRGLGSLAAFAAEGVALEAGPEAGQWFAALLHPGAASGAGALSAQPGAAASVPSGAAALGPEIRLEDLDLPPAAGSPLPSVEEAFAALAAEFAPSTADFAPSAAELDHIASGGLDQVDPSLLPPPLPSLSFAIAPAAPVTDGPLTDAPVSDGPMTDGPTADGWAAEGLASDAAADLPPQAAAPGEPSGAEDPTGLGRPWLGRVRGLLRTCFEETIGSLSPAPPVEPLAVATSPRAESEPVGTESVAEPLAPWPAFHPTASILAALPEPPAAAPAPAPTRWLPRIGLVAPAPRPAPAPADLADLRAWLPDAADDLPRAC
jgi:hypothetical protein